MKTADCLAAIIGIFCTVATGCVSTYKPLPPRVPSVEYSQRLRQEGETVKTAHSIPQEHSGARARLYLAKETNSEEPHGQSLSGISPVPVLLDESAKQQEREEDFTMYAAPLEMRRDYVGPLSLGEPGVSSSLWQENSGDNGLFRDIRAYLPGDLVTIIVEEKADATGEADTEAKSQSSFSAAIASFLGYETALQEKNPRLDMSSLINATTSDQFKGEGETTRKSSLKASISAMVVEVFPAGLLRIEGEKIIALNGEEQIMKISGIIRPRDINSVNEVQSSKLASVRIDYFGRGVIGEAQRKGWLSRALRYVWPF